MTFPSFIKTTSVRISSSSLSRCEVISINLPLDVGIVAPSIISKQTKEDINPKILSRPKKIKLLSLYYGFQFLLFYRVYNWLSVNKAKLRGYKQKHFPKKSYRTGQEMYAAHGSIMIFTKNYFK